jgi:hypothetical protein
MSKYYYNYYILYYNYLKIKSYIGSFKILSISKKDSKII